MKHAWMLFAPLLFAVASCHEDKKESLLDLLVVDVDSGAIIERWAAPRRTFDVKQDPLSGRVFAMSESDGPGLWELSASAPPRLIHELGGTEAYPFGDHLPDDIWFDRGYIDIDSARRRIVFASPRSDRIVLMDIDTEATVLDYATWTLWHSVALDPVSDTAYATANFRTFSFRISDGEILDEDQCVSEANEDWANATTTVMVSIEGRRLLGINGESILCERALAGSSLMPTFAPIWCGTLPCVSAGMASNDAGSELFIANTAFGEVYPPSLTFWNLETDVQTKVTVPEMPHGLALVPNGGPLFAANYFCNRIGVYDPGDTAHLYDIEVDGRPWGMDVSADESRLFVTQFERNGSREVGYYGADADDDCPELLTLQGTALNLTKAFTSVGSP